MCRADDVGTSEGQVRCEYRPMKQCVNKKTFKRASILRNELVLSQNIAVL